MIVHIIKQRLIEENRERKIESILEDKPFVPYTEEMAMSDITDDFCNQLKIALKLPVKYISDM